MREDCAESTWEADTTSLHRISRRKVIRCRWLGTGIARKGSQGRQDTARVTEMSLRTEEPINWPGSTGISRGRETEAGHSPSLPYTSLLKSTSQQTRDARSEGSLSMSGDAEGLDHTAVALGDVAFRPHSRTGHLGASVPAVLALSLSGCWLWANGRDSEAVRLTWKMKTTVAPTSWGS